MKVILLADVPKLGQKYETKSVAPGYARNYLIPHGLAEIATDGSLAKIDMLRSLHEEKKREQEARLMTEIEKIAGKTITIQEKSK
jgi:large subunit ribosomal protein L9